MNKSSKNLLAAFVAGVGAGIWAGLEFSRVNKARSPINSVKNPWRSSDEDEELQEWLDSMKGKSLHELKEIQMNLLYEVNPSRKEAYLKRIIFSMESEEFDKNFSETCEEIKEAQRKTTERINSFRKEMDSGEEI